MCVCVDELTTKLVEVGLDFPPGVQEHSALLRPDRDHAVLVYGDARHLCVELRHRRALKNAVSHTPNPVW